MNKGKRKRLERAGWVVGSTKAFLGLSETESALIEMKLSLSRSLRERRRRRGLSQTGLAKRLRSSQSRVAKMETGDPSVSMDLLVRSLLALGANSRDLASAIRAGGASGVSFRGPRPRNPGLVTPSARNLPRTRSLAVARDDRPQRAAAQRALAERDKRRVRRR